MSVRRRLVARCAWIFAGMIAMALGPVTAEAQAPATFRWQQEPYCNVITLVVTQLNGTFNLTGFDDQCGATTRAAASGVAFPNPDGSIGLGLTIVTTPGSAPIHLDAIVNLATISGTWHDNTGATGAWRLTTVAGAGSPRPAAPTVFSAGLSMNGSTIGGLGTPAAPDDAASKGYVDAGDAAVLAVANAGGATAAAAIAAGDAATLAAANASIAAAAAAGQTALATGLEETREYARSVAAAPLQLSAYSAVSDILAVPATGGCMIVPSGGIMRLDLPVPVGATITNVTAKLINSAPSPMNLRFHAVTFVNGTPPTDIAELVLAIDPSSGVLVAPMIETPRVPTSAERSYYVAAVSFPYPLGPDQRFCGVVVHYTLP